MFKASFRPATLAMAGLLLGACLAGPAPAPPAAPRHAASVSLSPDEARLAVANLEAGTVTLVDAALLSVIAEVPVGRAPRSLAFTDDGAWIVVANFGSGTLSFVDVNRLRVEGEVAVGRQPFAVVVDGRRAYASLFAAGEVVVVDLVERVVTGRIDVEPFPTGLALAGDRLFVSHLYTGRVSSFSRVDLSPGPWFAAHPESNLAQSIVVAPGGRSALLPVTLSHSDNPALSEYTTVSPVLNLLDLTNGESRAIALSADRAVNLPSAAALHPDGRTAFVANTGTDDISVVDLEGARVVGRLPTGPGPRGLALASDGCRLFVNNELGGSLDVFECDARYHEAGRAPISHYSHRATITLTSFLLPEPMRTGQRLFHSARPPMSNGWLSCATCHFDGGHDARTWHGFPDGPRNTPALWGAARTPPFHWSGDLDELHDVEFTIRHIQYGAGLIDGAPHPALGTPNLGRSAGLDALAAYVASLAVPPAPAAPPASDVLDRGERAFRRWGCGGCHRPPLYSDLRSHLSDVGQAAAQRNPRGLSMDTPSLLGAWATAPYFHDGSAATLRDTIFQTGFHGMGHAMDAREVDDLLAFLLALPAE